MPENQIWKKHRKKILVSLILILVIFFADFIANDKPVICRCDGAWKIPPWEKNSGLSSMDYKDCTHKIYPIIRYNAYGIDVKNSNYKSPFEKQDVSSIWKRHWLGTDKLGRDVAAGIIHGARVSLSIGLWATILSLLFGVPTGLALGYYQDNTLKWNIVQWFWLATTLVLGLFYGLYITADGHFVMVIMSILLYLIFMFAIFKVIGKLPLKKYNFPLDLLGFRVLEWRKSIPALFLLLALLSLFSTPSAYNVVFIIGLLSWADIARMVRAETLSAKNNLFVQSAITLGFSHLYLIKNYILPNLKGSIFVIGMYIMAGAILLEASLSFLGLGLPVEEVSWGKMLAESRNARAWWMAVFPGGCLIALLFFLHKLTNNQIQKN